MINSCCRFALWAILVLSISESVRAEERDHRAVVTIERRTTIVSPESSLKLERAMLGMQRHPDGSILICVQSVPVLLRSTDQGSTWDTLEVKLSRESEDPIIHGLGVSGDGRVWLMHQTRGSNGTDLFVSVSKERRGSELTFATTQIDYTRLAPNPEQPYAFCYNDYNTFFERPDGTMALGVGLQYEDHGDYQQEDQSRPGFHETLIRSSDGGKTWNDPTEVHAHVAETGYAVDPRDPHHILAITRKQRQLLRGEDAVTVARHAGVPVETAWPWKGSILLESTNGGRTFREVPDSYLGYYSHRATILWTDDNVIVAPHTAAGPGDYRLVVNISLDGGQRWVDGTERGAPTLHRAKGFVLVPNPPGFSYTTPTVELSRNRFLTVHYQGSPLGGMVTGVFWNLETPKEKPISIGSERQLFIDDRLIESLEGASQTLNPPEKHPANPILSRGRDDDPTWDSGMPISFSSVLYDEREQLFKMWYGLHSGSGGDEASVLCFATSVDGLQWQKPKLGLFEYRGTKENNILLPHSGLACGVFKDLRETDLSKQYKMIHMWHDYKVYASYSSDGLRWTPYNDGQAVFLEPPGHDSHMIAYWDEGLGKYVAIIRDRTGRISDVRSGLVSDEVGRQGWRKLWDSKGNRSPENHSIRRVAQIESDDFIHWTNYRVIHGPDKDDPLNRDQFYNMEVMPYEGLRLGLMTVFSYDPDYCRGAVQLTYSRDGRHWHRAGNRDVFLPLSSRVGDFDWGSIYPLQRPFVHDDEIWIYYNGYGVDHNLTPPPGVDDFPNGIGLAKLRVDGFVSVDAGETGGTLTTKPLTFTGERLIVNANATHGHVTVEFLDASGRPIVGYGEPECDAIKGDSLRHTVTWKGKADISRLEGTVVKLRFSLRKAKLYSFSFWPGGGDHRVSVEIGKRVQVVPPGVLTRAMMSMVRHPDGTIYLNTQTGPLFKSSDDGETWTPVEVKLTGVPGDQVLNGLGVNRTGRLFLDHQSTGRDPKDKRLYGQDLFVSYSDDGGRTWMLSETDFGNFSPGIPNMKFHEDGARTFIEQADGTLMFATTIVPAEDYLKVHPAKSPPEPPNYEYGGTANDTFGDVVFRSTDGGKTWGDPTRVYTDLNAHESALAIDPRNSNRLLEFARIQRLVRPGEDGQKMMRETGNPRPYYKQGALFESVDGGRTFRLAPGGMTDWYGHRGSILWTGRNVVVLTHNGGQGDSRLLTRISLDGARTWVDGTEEGTSLMTKSMKVTLAPSHSFASPTVELRKRNHFLTVYCTEDFEVKGVFWRLRTK